MNDGSPGAPSRVALGRLGEDLAAAYLRLAGYRILERNLRISHKEIDLLALQGDCLVFVEVKLRRSDRCGRAAESLDQRKRRHLRAGLRELVWKRGWRGSYRMDLLALDWRQAQDRLELEHYRGL